MFVCVPQGLVAWVGSEPTPSESLVTSEDEVMRPPPTNNTTNEGVESELSATPPNETPFAADNIGDTVVRLDKVHYMPVLLDTIYLKDGFNSGGDFRDHKSNGIT